jgi:16S rRNA (guanine527-N7)-methyltransferase
VSSGGVDDVQLDEPPEAAALFADRLDLARAYAARLATDGVTRGLIGPREAPILWRRHLLNCALIADLAPVGSRIVDVGSGAGLPGIVLAIRRPDLRVDLVEPLLRRTTFLSEVVDELGLGTQIRVVRGRADEKSVRTSVGGADRVVARAVAPLDRLVRWCLPLVGVEGEMMAMKGQRADEEIASAAPSLAALRARVLGVSVVGEGADETRVVRIGWRPSAGIKEGKRRP